MMIDLSLLCTDIKDTESNFRKNIDGIIQRIYDSLHHPSEKTEQMIAGWREECAYLYGDRASALSFGGQDAQLLFYAVQTCFSILLKELLRQTLKDVCAPVRQADAAVSGCPDAAALLRGDFALRYGIENYGSHDWYVWPLYELENGFGDIIEEMAELLSAYESGMSPAEFVQGNKADYIRQMYETMIPKGLRHTLGEFYTPDWLAERTFKEALQFTRKPVAELSLADPTCGSGTFLMQGILAKRKAGCDLENILASVSGFDINPLAVLMAKTNYLLAVADLLGQANHLRLPVYREDILRLAEPEVWIREYNRQVDLVIGNPPWVNWEYLPKSYRNRSRHLWTAYGLFSAKGRDLSFSKEDISVLITYVVMDRLLKEHGVIGFVIRQGVFKSASNGMGFRRFRIREECGIRVLRVEDLSRMRVFDDAAASTALFFAEKGADTVYPVPYYVWDKGSDPVIIEQCAMPAAAEDITSVWITAGRAQLEGMKQALGSNPYRARTGVFTGGANGVYRLHIHERRGNRIRVSNLVEQARRKVEQVETELEPDYVFPMVKGSNVRRWHVTYDTYLLCPHTRESRMWPVSGEELRETCPLTYAYLERFRGELDSRKGFAGWEKEIQKREFHAVLRVGDYTFSRYKVIWKYIASEFICAVLGEGEDVYLGRKPWLPNEKIMYVGMDDETEAYYLCGILSSSLIAGCVQSYMNPTNISAHVLDKLNIPPFDAGDERHTAIAAACREGHGREDIRPCLDRIDELVAQMYASGR